jgi:hypothetical protein
MLLEEGLAQSRYLSPPHNNLRDPPHDLLSQNHLLEGLTLLLCHLLCCPLPCRGRICGLHNLVELCQFAI